MKLVTTVEQMARTTAATAKRERERCAKLLEDLAAAARDKQKHQAAQALEIGALAIREETTALQPEGPKLVADTPAASLVEDDLPAVHHMDDVEEGIAMVQGGMHRRGLTGYAGRTGALRD